MNLHFILKKTIFSRVFQVFLIVTCVPLIFVSIMILSNDEYPDFWVNFLLIAGLFLITFIATFIGTYHLSRRISRPIMHFSKSATEIARGNFTHRIEVNSDDEIGRLAKIFNYMVTELQRLDEMNLNKIISEKNKTETIIKNIADGVIVTDHDNRILVLNSVAEKWFGIKERDVLQLPIENLIADERLVALIKKIRAAENGTSSSIEIQLNPPKNRKTIILQAKAARVVRGKNELIGIVTILRDITQEREIDRMKTELVSMVAHELRSPLTSISGFSELLLDVGVSEGQAREYAEIILKESNRLGDLINKFLDISRIESGKSQVRKVPAKIYEIVSNVLGMNIHLAERKNINVNINVPNDLPVINLDKDMIGEVILNLFTNAVKYSPENSSIEVNAREIDNLIEIKVIDSGYGISKEALPRVFEKFYRVTDNEKIREITGSGLGLSLVKEIIEIHNGTIEVDSELGVGSTFTIRLPIEEPMNQDLSPYNPDDYMGHVVVA